MTLGERLKKARKLHGFTQDGLAKMIGTSRGVITNIEHNKIETPQPLIINALCNALEISHNWLLYGNGTMDNSELVKSAKILNEIHTIAKDLSVNEQLYILDMIKTYKKYLNKERE